MTGSGISAFRAAKRRVPVLDSMMAYHETGQGDTILLLHGNPTSSILWRDVIPKIAHLGRCIAPDLIGMGDSGKRPADGTNYRFVEHRRYLDQLLDQLDIGDRVTLVLHDWGSALGFDWARRHPHRVRAIAYMEAIVTPLTWDDWPDRARGIFQGMRSAKGERLVLDDNSFVERILPSSILRGLTEAEHDEYRRPFQAREDRWPTLQWPREIPIDGHPADVVRIVTDYASWLATTDLPKLFVNADPSSILLGRQREFCRTWPNQTEVTVAGVHFVQEDSVDAIGAAIADWLPATSRPVEQGGTE